MIWLIIAYLVVGSFMAGVATGDNDLDRKALVTGAVMLTMWLPTFVFVLGSSFHHGGEFYLRKLADLGFTSRGIIIRKRWGILILRAAPKARDGQ